ncbi:MAG TPA: choice-of-anchor Q domain-containing protein [Verrucomicrobiae bacterium]|nr:choice-of-anchor Q domain-containing protein [Verrucomicrobiae bacterium]
MRAPSSISIAVSIAFLFTFHIEGSTFLITNTNDSTNLTSLRGAIIKANRKGGNNTIILGQAFEPRRNSQQRQWIFPLNISGADEDGARTGDLDVTRGNLTIIGATSNVIVDATGLGDRVFQVFSNAHLTLSDLVIRGGTAPGNGRSYLVNGEAGGAIYNAGTLFLEHCTVTNNSSGGGNFSEGNIGGTSGGDGGGIYSSGKLTMNNCIVAGNSSGTGADGAGGGSGGGIKNDGTCRLTACVISENLSGNGGGPEGNAVGAGGWGGNGGGIYNSGLIELNYCIVSANTSGQGSNGGDPSGTTQRPALGGPGGSGGNGAGVYNEGQMRLNYSTVNGNSCGNGGNGDSASRGGNAGAGGSGAAIFNTGDLSLNTSTISENFCGNGGMGGNGAFGGFGSLPPSGGGTGGGGGIYNAGSLDLSSCTVVLNQTGVGGNGGNSLSFGSSSLTAASGGRGGDGGGILNANNASLVVRNTLIALNLINVGGSGGTNIEYYQTTEQIGDSGADGICYDVAGDFTSQGFNLVSIGDGSTGFTNGINANQVGSIANPIDPLIGSLQMNGGFTPTHALLPGSPAIDQGNSFRIRADQRRHRRPYDYTSISNAQKGDGSDIGAVELDN